jgi:hydrogenase-4 component B
MIGTLVVAALVLFALGAAVDLVLGAEHRWSRVAPGVTGVLGAAAAAAAGGLELASDKAMVAPLGSVLEIPGAAARVDHLSGLFLVIAFGLALPASAALAAWAWPEGRLAGRGAGAGLSMVLGAIAVVLVAGDAFTFLFGWETLTVGFVVLSGWSRRSRSQASSTWVTGAVGKASGAALLVGFLLVAAKSHSLDLATWSLVPGGALRDAAWALVVGGFGAKVGLLPFQVWQPVGYPTAPGVTRAVMAGVAVNVGFYGLWRVLGILGSPPVWLVVVVLILGGAGALLGVVFASVEVRLARLLAYSSVENAGIIVVAFGVAMAGAAEHAPALVAAGMLAATVQVIAHGLAKTGAFAAASFAESARGSDELERLRGFGGDHPWAASALGLASASLAGLPPMIGFVSEWLVLETLMQEFRVHELAVRVAMVLAGAAVALTAGIAVATFARVLGMVVFGRDPARVARQERRVARGASVGAAFAGVALLGLVGTAAVAPWVVRLAANGLAPVVERRAVLGALEQPWVLEPVYKGFSVLSPSWFVVVLPLAILAVGATAWAVSAGRLLRWRRVPAWRSASGELQAPSAYSTFAYANPLRHVFANVLGAQRSVVRSDDGASPLAKAGDAALVVETGVREPTVAFFYRPLRRVWIALARLVRRLQSGRLEAYVSYMLAALVAVVALVVAMR